MSAEINGGTAANFYAAVNLMNEKKKNQKGYETSDRKTDSAVSDFKQTPYADSSKLLGIYGLASLNLNKTWNKIPNGHSKYEYKGAKLDVYKRGRDYQSQFTAPFGYNEKEFAARFSNIDEILNNRTAAPGLKTRTETLSGINGSIDENVIQGNTGSCWLISGLFSLASSEKGRDIIKNAVSENSDGSVTVNFAGIGKSYTVSALEIQRYDTDNNTEDSYSNGDNDVLVFELAVEKLWNDINSGKVTLNTSDENLTYAGEGGGIDDGGLPSQIIYYLTGIESDEYYYDDLRNLGSDVIDSVLQEALDSGNKSLNFAVYFDDHSAELTDGTLYSLNVGYGGHALAVTDITQNTVTFVNPWDTSSSYTMTWSEFSKLGIGYISSTDLTDAQSEINSDNETDDNISDASEDIFNIDYGFDYYDDFSLNAYYSFMFETIKMFIDLMMQDLYFMMNYSGYSRHHSHSRHSIR